MKYITHRRFKSEAICGKVNIPAMSECEKIGDVIFYRGKPICFATSENAHQFFARNNDGQGMTRGKLTQAILGTLKKRDSQYQERWNRVWDDPLCQKFKRPEDEDYWLWNHDFFQADINELRHIAFVAGVKEVI